MGIAARDLRLCIIKPVLTQLEAVSAIPHTQVAEDLLMATAAQESSLGTHLVQIGGPALGIYQIEPPSLDDLLGNFIQHSPRYNPGLQRFTIPGETPEQQIVWNLAYATVVCRLFYYRVKSPLPPSSSAQDLWSYYKPHYNTDLGAATFASWQQALKLTDIAQ